MGDDSIFLCEAFPAVQMIKMRVAIWDLQISTIKL
jgi:hypothetical protein